MNRRERFFAAVEGREVDRPPVTAWVHFLSDHLSARDMADLYLKFLREYNWDIAKIVNDYRYPLPSGMERLDSPEAMRRFKRISLDDLAFSTQLELIRILRSELGPEWPIVDTSLDPYQQVVRNIGLDERSNIPLHPEAALEMLDAVTATLCDYARASRQAGADGYFLSINSAIRDGFPRGVTDSIYRDFQRPFEIRMLEAAKGSVRMLHVHGIGLDIDRVMDYPCEVISWSDRLPGNPTLTEIRKRTDKCLMGGINEARIQELALPDLRAEIDDAVAQVGRRRLILSPGCTVPSFTSVRTLHCLSDHARQV